MLSPCRTALCSTVLVSILGMPMTMDLSRGLPSSLFTAWLPSLMEEGGIQFVTWFSISREDVSISLSAIAYHVVPTRCEKRPSLQPLGTISTSCMQMVLAVITQVVLMRSTDFREVVLTPLVVYKHPRLEKRGTPEGRIRHCFSSGKWYAAN